MKVFVTCFIALLWLIWSISYLDFLVYQENEWWTFPALFTVVTSGLFAIIGVDLWWDGLLKLRRKS